ncbi:MAG: type II CAAX endopeptidase family protein [Candidatus Saccharibacteria bacterium]|nr:type II CAAX endopeptidase family protein [Candidatus Saccharibacteria bacterium]
MKIILICILVLASVFGSQFLVGTILTLIFGEAGVSSPLGLMAYSLISYVLAMVLIMVVPVKMFKKADLKTDREELGLLNPPTLTDIGLMPVGFIAQLVLSMGLVAVFSVFPWFNADESQGIGLQLFINPSDRVIMFITLAIIAPIMEEVIFRGWMYGKIREILSQKVSEAAGIIIATFTVSLVFAILHLQLNVGVNVFALSVILCGLREVTGTIHAGILTHMLKNAVAIFAILLFGF